MVLVILQIRGYYINIFMVIWVAHAVEECVIPNTPRPKLIDVVVRRLGGAVCFDTELMIQSKIIPQNT